MMVTLDYVDEFQICFSKNGMIKYIPKTKTANFIPLTDFTKINIFKNPNVYYRFKTELQGKSVIPRSIKDSTLNESEFNYFIKRNVLEFFYKVGG